MATAVVQGHDPVHPAPARAVDSAGTDPAAVDSAGADSVGTDSTAVDSAGIDSTAVDPAGAKSPGGIKIMPLMEIRLCIIYNKTCKPYLLLLCLAGRNRLTQKC